MSAVLDKPLAAEQPVVEPHALRFTVEDFYRMGEAGVFAPEQRVELIEGEIIEMAPIGASHADWVDKLTMLFAKAVPDGIRVRVQNPIRLSNRTEPEPDLALLCPREQPYSQAHPSGPDTLLVVEVAETSLRYDRDVKMPLYARLGVPELWIFDIKDGALTIYREPSADGYRLQLRPALDETVSPQALPELHVELTRLFPPAQG